MASLDIAVVILYFLGILAVGIYVSTRIEGLADFVVAGRTLTAPILIGSLVATYYGLDVSLGAPETSFLEGMSTFWLYSAPFYVSYVLMALLIARRVRESEVLTLPDYFAARFGRGLLLPTSVVTFSYSLPVMSVFGFGLLGEYFFGVPLVWSMLAGGLFSALYATAGGMLADAVTDLVQFVLMCLTVGMIAGFALLEVGSLADFAAALAPEMTSVRGALSTGDILVYLAVALTPLVDPGLYQRIFAARDVPDIRRALLASALIWMAFDWLVVYLGLVAAHLVAEGAMNAVDDPAMVMLHLSTHFLPVGLVGLFVAGLLSTAMSTVDSYAIISATAAVRAFARPGGEYGDRARRQLLWIRIGIPQVVLLSILVAARFERVRDTWIVMASLLVSGLLISLLASFLPGRGEALARFARASCWTGIVAAVLLFAAFEIFGIYDPEYVSRRLSFAGVSVLREQLVFISLPLALAAGLFAMVTTRHAGGRP